MTMSAENVKFNTGRGEKFFNFRPCLFIAFFICLGILCARWFLENGVSFWWCASILALPPILFVYFKNKRAFLVGVALALCFLVGFSSYSLKAKDFMNTTYYNSYDSTAYGRVIKKADYGEQTRLVLVGVSIDGKEEKGGLVVTLPTAFCENVRLSDYVFIRGRIKTETQLFGKDATFEEYFADDIRFNAYAEKLSVAGHKFDAFASAKELLEERLCQAMGKDSATVAFGILTGDVSGIDDGLLDNVRRGGIAHIFAVSGLHIGSLYAVCVFLINKFKSLQDKKILRLILIAIVLLLYGGFCGYSESVVRAIVMCLIAYGSSLVGIKKDIAESVSLSACLLLIVNPVSLFCVGFQLSFSACYGIAFLGKPLQIFQERVYRKLLRRTEEYPVTYLRGERAKIFSFLSVTVGAQLFTAPILLSAYGYLSAWGLLLNAIFVPCVGFIFSLTLGCSFLACLLPSVLSGIILWLPNMLWTLALLIFQTLDFAIILQNVTLSGLFTLCYYLILIVLSGKLNLKRTERAVVLLILVLSCVCAYIIL